MAVLPCTRPCTPVSALHTLTRAARVAHAMFRSCSVLLPLRWWCPYMCGFAMSSHSYPLLTAHCPSLPPSRPIVDSVPTGFHINFLRAERSLHRWAREDVARIHAAEAAASADAGGVQMHVLEDAGHWVSEGDNRVKGGLLEGYEKGHVKQFECLVLLMFLGAVQSSMTSGRQ